MYGAAHAFSELTPGDAGHLHASQPEPCVGEPLNPVWRQHGGSTFRALTRGGISAIRRVQSDQLAHHAIGPAKPSFWWNRMRALRLPSPTAPTCWRPGA